MAVKKAFLSSTARDLTEYRHAVCKEINRLDNWKCVRMEDFGARSRTAEALDDDAVRDCDLFIGILGHCYGSIPEGHRKLSYTEKEFNAAVANNLPRLMFLAPDDFPVPAHLREDEYHWKRQKAFRSRVQTHSVHASFSTPHELAIAVLQAIRNWEHEEQQRNDRLPPVSSIIQLNNIDKKEEIPRRFVDYPPHWRFIESLPEVKAIIYRDSQKDWDSGVTQDMIHASYELIDFLKASWVRLAEFYPPDHFDGKTPREHIGEYLQNRFSYHRNKYDLGEPSGPETMFNVMTGGCVIKDLEDMVSDTVAAISLYNDKFDYPAWKERWQKTLNSTN